MPDTFTQNRITMFARNVPSREFIGRSVISHKNLRLQISGSCGQLSGWKAQNFARRLTIKSMPRRVTALRVRYSPTQQMFISHAKRLKRLKKFSDEKHARS